jgi:hypothetical protein
VGEMLEDGKFRVDKFSSQNYQLWKMQIWKIIYIKGSIPTTGQNNKEADGYEGRIMGDS